MTECLDSRRLARPSDKPLKVFEIAAWMNFDKVPLLSSIVSFFSYQNTPKRTRVNECIMQSHFYWIWASFGPLDFFLWTVYAIFIHFLTLSLSQKPVINVTCQKELLKCNDTFRSYNMSIESKIKNKLRINLLLLNLLERWSFRVWRWWWHFPAPTSQIQTSEAKLADSSRPAH